MAAELLAMEFAVFQPARVLFATDMIWADPFLERLNIETREVRREYVQKMSDDGRRRIVVAARPDSRRLGHCFEDWVQDVESAFANS